MKKEETDKCVTSIQEVDSKRRRVFINYEPAFVFIYLRLEDLI